MSEGLSRKRILGFPRCLMIVKSTLTHARTNYPTLAHFPTLQVISALAENLEHFHSPICREVRDLIRHQTR